MTFLKKVIYRVGFVVGVVDILRRAYMLRKGRK